MKPIAIKLISLLFVIMGGVAGVGLLLGVLSPVAHATVSADDPTPTPVCPSGSTNTGSNAYSSIASSHITQTIGSTATISVTIKNSNNCVPTAGVSVSMSGGGATVMTPSMTTNTSSGIAIFVVSATVAGTYNFTASAPTGVSKNISITFVTAGVDAGASTVIAAPTSIPADGLTLANVTVTLKDGLDNPVTGKVVTIASSRGITDTIFPVSGVTNAAGQATFKIKSLTPGSSVITATDTTDVLVITQTATITFTVGTVSASTSTVVAVPTSLEADGVSTSTITVTLRDSISHLVSGKVVTITSSRGVTDTITTVSETTNASGQATFTLKSSTPGSSVITAEDVTDSLFVTETASPIFIAAGPDFFVKTNGSGITCSQASPCKLTTALTQSVSGDNIYVAAGTYTGTGNAVISLTASVALYGGWNGASSGGVVRNPNAYVSILDGQNQRRVIYINASLTPTIDGFTIARGNAVGKPYGGWTGGVGAGVFGQSTNPIISNNIITHNTILTSGTPAGAGIYLSNASAASRIEGNTIISNTAGSSCFGYGGGILLDSSNTVVQTNTLTLNCASVGSALNVNYMSPLIRNNVIQSNAVGGAVHVLGSSALIQSNQIISNSLGGLVIYNTPVTIDRNVIAYNGGYDGAGINSGNEGTVPFTITNNFIYSNTASQNGGGFYISSSHFYPGPGAGVLLHNTFAKNSPEAVYVTEFSSITLTNNILVTHTVGICVESGALTVTVKADYTLFFGNSGGNITGAGCSSVVTNTNPLIGSAPRFIDEVGGNYHLSLISPAVNAGASAGITTDYDGQTRDSLPDIGADELISFLLYLAFVSK